jgi:hypothetical protein
MTEAPRADNAHQDWTELDASPGHFALDADGLRAALLDASKLWLAHDGLWFLEWEAEHGMDAALQADAAAWKRFAALEAKRIMGRLGLMPGGGVEALARCLPHRLYANICRFTMHARAGELKLRMVECRVQDARERKGRPSFPCKCIGIIEFDVFARTVDPRLATTCEQCPPDELTSGGWCEWRFKLVE